jgi:hypothetical protein
LSILGIELTTNQYGYKSTEDIEKTYYQKATILDHDTVTIMKGALKMKEKTVMVNKKKILRKICFGGISFHIPISSTIINNPSFFQYLSHLFFY